jgi:hypothetical protein
MRVLSANRLDVMLDLDFGFTLRRVFRLKGFDSHGLGREAYDAAKHCLITLAGSKKLIVRPEPSTRRDWHTMTVIPANVYLPVRLDTKPIGFVEDMPDAHGAALDLGTHMKWLGTRGFEVQLVRDMLRR